MRRIKRGRVDADTLRELAYLLIGVPLGLVWLTAVTIVCSLLVGLLITPFSIGLALGLAFMTRGFAAVEAEIARALLHVDAHAPSVPRAAGGMWPRLRGMFGPGFWRAQGYLLVRSLAGVPAGLAIFTLLVTAIGLILAPVWIPFVHGGAHLGFWRPHTLTQALALVPAGLILLPVTLLIVTPLAGVFGTMASGLLHGQEEDRSGGDVAAHIARPNGRRALRVHGAADGALVGGSILIWALTSRGYFWPVWIALPLLVALAVHAWFILLAERPSLVQAFRGSRVLAGTVGVGAVIEMYFIALWAITGHGYFWPIWTLLAIGIVCAAAAIPTVATTPDHAEMAERIETLETSRAGAVDLQESELRRIERDLHDGAQARLVALGMSLGMAEQKLADDPQRAGELLAEARAGAEHALRELRDLARGIHPPVLADRGLEAALASLASATPMPVTLSVDTAGRPAPAIETAAYFVAAEALANAAKHARAERVEIRVTHTGDQLELEVRDDGTGGADPEGGGLSGMRRRVEALDGKLLITSPRGGPTTVRAELPCAS